MDCSGGGDDYARVCDYFSGVSVLHLHEIWNWLSVLVLYEKVCDTAFDFTADYSDVLLQEANFLQ